MSVSRTFRSRLAALAPAAAVLLRAAAGRADDSVLFSTSSVSPNVLILMDNSGSMNNIIWYPTFVDGTTYSCNQAPIPTGYGVWNPSTQHTGAFHPGDTYYIDDAGKFFYYNSSGNFVQAGTNTRTHCGSTHTLPVDTTSTGGYTRYQGSYLNFLFSTAADTTVWNDINSNTNGVPSTCLGGANYPKYKRTRMNAAKYILKQVVCEVNLIGGVRVGIAVFRDESDPNGGYVMEPIDLV